MREQPSCVREREAPVASHTEASNIEASNIEAKRIEAESTTEEANHLGVPTFALLEVTGAGAMPRRSLGSLPEKMLQVGVTILMARHMGRLDAVQLTAAGATPKSAGPARHGVLATSARGRPADTEEDRRRTGIHSGGVSLSPPHQGAGGSSR